MADNWFNLQNASFRGVAFKDNSVSGKSGRRAIPHEYPKREQGWTEDNGAKLQQFSVSAIVIGNNYRAELNTLLAALNTPGPGKLVHPHFGERSIQIGDVSHKLFANRAMAEVSFECFDSGLQVNPSQTENTEVALQTSVNDGLKQVESDFESDFNVEELPSWDLQSLSEQARGYIDDTTEFFRQITNLPDTIRTVLDEAEAFKSSVASLLAVPGDLAREFANLFDRASDLVTRPADELEVYDQLQRRYEGKRYEREVTKALAPVPVPGTLLEIKQAREIELEHLVLAQITILSAGTISKMDFTDAVAANATAKRLDDNLLTEAVITSNLGHRDGFLALRKITVDLRSDINKRALLLPQVRTITANTTEPLILMAYRETGDAKNREKMVARNRPKNPAFILPGTKLELING